MQQELHEWAMRHAFTVQGRPFPDHQPLIACSVDLGNMLTLFYCGSSWHVEPSLYPEHHVRIRMLPPAGYVPLVVHPATPIKSEYRSMVEFAADLRCIMDTDLIKRATLGELQFRVRGRPIQARCG